MGNPSAHAVFRRALQRRSLLNARTAALELPAIGLADALELTLLALEQDPSAYPGYAGRWLALWIQHHRPDLHEIRSTRGSVRAAGGRSAS